MCSHHQWTLSTMTILIRLQCISLNSNTLSISKISQIFGRILPPDIGEYHEEAEAVISHELLAHELLGGKADLKPGRNTEFELNRQVRKDKIDSKIRWMISGHQS